MNILVVCAHLDDETFGMYGTLDKYKEHNIKVISLCEGRRTQDRNTRREAFKDNMGAIGTEYKIYEYLDLELYKEQESKISDIIRNEILNHNTDILFITSSDLHAEHQLINRCSRVAVRNTSVKKMLEMYIPGSSDIKQFNAPFVVNIDIINKLDACKKYTSEIDSRLLKNIRIASEFIGINYNFENAEMFNIIFDKGNL